MVDLGIRNRFDSLLSDLAKERTLDKAESVVSAVLGLLNLKAESRYLVNIPRVDAEISRFELAPNFDRQAAAFEIPTDKPEIFDPKLFWIKKTTKTNLSWVIGVAPNFEDSEANDYKSIGIDFVVPSSCDSIIILLSNKYKIRSLELKGHLTQTQHEILSSWTQIETAGVGELSQLKKDLHSKLWESFNFEPTNRKFYLELVEHFSLLVKHLEKTFGEKDSVMFTTRLIGRILFIWFLRKKNLVNQSMGYFTVEDPLEQTIYYRNTLEVLFFETLNKEISERSHKDSLTPYLNGGLFDISKTDFFNNDKLTFPNGYFNSLFDTLSKYNFTVDESSPEFQQVAIDPEMLGRIFESLLSEEIDEVSGSSRKKITGAFYTPREIVNYMCEQSILEFLKSKVPYSPERDKRIEELIELPETIFRDQDQNKRRDWKPYSEAIIKALDGNGEGHLTILDPAVGSGAFPMGMLHVLTKIYSRLDPKYERNISKLKRSILSKSLYGVDIEQTAIEICRLRAWLSIIVDTPETDVIEPLPNLDFKFTCANTLVPLDSNKQDTLFDDHQLKEKLMAIRDEYFTTSKKNKKKSLQDEYVRLTHQEDIFENKKTKQLKSYRPFDTASCSEFYDPELHHGVKSFDVVIGNPPYIKEFTSRKAFDGVRESPYYQGKMDLWYIFACQGIDYLKDKTGVLSFIATNNWVTNSGASILRKKVLEDTRILKLIDFGSYMIFDSASIQTMIMVFSKNKMDATYQFDYRRLTGSSPRLEDVIGLLNGVKADNAFFIQAKLDPAAYKDKALIFNQSDSEELLNKIKAKTNFYLDPKKEVAQGIVAPQDSLSKKGAEILGADYKAGSGIFVLTDKEVQALGLTPKESEILKPYYTTTELGRFSKTRGNSLWVIYTDSSYKNAKSMDEYPNLKKHLDKYKNIITSDNKPYGLHRSRDNNFFIGEKIVSLRKTPQPHFTFTDFDCYVSQTFNVIKSFRVNMKFLTGLLNSKLMFYWLKHKGKKQGEMLQVDKEPIIDLPICIPNDYSSYLTLIDQIISLRTSSGDSSELEKQLDHMIYVLYELSTDEIDNIEKALVAS
jgi:adenine-specific DNA-methyltransferase